MGSSNSSHISNLCTSTYTSVPRIEFIQKLKDFADDDPTFYLIRKGKYALYSAGNPSPIMAAVQFMACHEYVIIEYGRKLKKKIDGFSYAKALRLDFGNNGYCLSKVATKDYWNVFKEEKGEQKGSLGKSWKCQGTIDSLIEIVRIHKNKYELATNNCTHFTQEVWEEMVMPKRETYDL